MRFLSGLKVEFAQRILHYYLYSPLSHRFCASSPGFSRHTSYRVWSYSSWRGCCAKRDHDEETRCYAWHYSLRCSGNPRRSEGSPSRKMQRHELLEVSAGKPLRIESTVPACTDHTNVKVEDVLMEDSVFMQASVKVGIPSADLNTTVWKEVMTTNWHILRVSFQIVLEKVEFFGVCLEGKVDFLLSDSPYNSRYEARDLYSSCAVCINRNIGETLDFSALTILFWRAWIVFVLPYSFRIRSAVCKNAQKPYQLEWKRWICRTWKKPFLRWKKKFHLHPEIQELFTT